MTDHPLTDHIIEEISYLKNCEGVKSNMRAATDWQLEQAVKYLEDEIGELILCCEGISTDRFVDSLKKEFIDDFRKAMRPQVVNLPQANSDVCGEEGIERARQQTFEENDELMRKLSDS